MKNVNSVNKAIRKAQGELTSIRLKDINRPKTIEEGRANLRRFYGCVDDDLLVLLNTKDTDGTKIKFNQGIRENGKWISLYENDQSALPEPHTAINKIIVMGDYAYANINIDAIDCLSDLYKITETGCFRGRWDPSFTMNLILGGKSPITEYDDNYTYKSFKLYKDIQSRLNLKYWDSDWVEDSSAYDIYDNNDKIVKEYGGFYPYSLEKGFNWRWKQMNNSDSRYLHWLLLGPLAPYQYSDSDVTSEAA